MNAMESAAPETAPPQTGNLPRLSHESVHRILGASAVLAFILVSTVGNVALKGYEDIKIVILHLNVSTSTFAYAVGDEVFFRVEPGKFVSGFLPVKNDDTYAKNMRLALRGPLAGTGWITTIPAKDFTLVAKETKVVGLNVSIPGSAAGEYEGELVIKAKKDMSQEPFNEF